MKPHEIQEKLGLTRIRDRNWHVQPSCATTGDGLYEGLTWLTSNHKLWTFQQWLATRDTHEIARDAYVVMQCSLVASLWSEVTVWLDPTGLQIPYGIGNMLGPPYFPVDSDAHRSVMSVVKLFLKFVQICSNKVIEGNCERAKQESKDLKIEYTVKIVNKDFRKYRQEG